MFGRAGVEPWLAKTLAAAFPLGLPASSAAHAAVQALGVLVSAAHADVERAKELAAVRAAVGALEVFESGFVSNCEVKVSSRGSRNDYVKKTKDTKQKH